jgi:hypothetical protein
MRNSVLIRAGFSTANGQAAGYFPLVEELLRQSQNELHLEAPWLQQRKRDTVSLIEDQAEYDLPDDAPMSRVGRFAVSDGTNEYDLVFGTGSIRNYTQTSSKPVYCEILDNVLHLYPAPSSTWTTLIYEYYAGPGTLVLDADRPTLPGEPLIQRATYLLKRHTGLGGDWQADREEHIRHLERLKQGQGEVRAIDMRPSSVRLGVKTGSGAPWTEDWNPW